MVFVRSIIMFILLSVLLLALSRTLAVFVSSVCYAGLLLKCFSRGVCNVDRAGRVVGREWPMFVCPRRRVLNLAGRPTTRGQT